MPELGIGFVDPASAPCSYGKEYFENYARLADTDIGRNLNAARVAMLWRHWCDPAGVVDIGIGAGTFVDAVPGARGYDVNPLGVEWLNERGLFFDPYAGKVDVACFWDALEHIANPARLLNNVRRLVLVSIPIFRDAEHVLKSKHLKPGEHIFYFTESGLLWFMREHGWHLTETNDYETHIGREDIKSFAFVR